MSVSIGNERWPDLQIDPAPGLADYMPVHISEVGPGWSTPFAMDVPYRNARKIVEAFRVLRRIQGMVQENP